MSSLPSTKLISPDQLRRYQAAAQTRQAQRQQRHLERQQLGWQVAQQAAQILKREFGVTQVKLFGSMLNAQRIHAESDVDLAVAGLADHRYLEAVTRLLDLSGLSVDLVQLEHASPKLQGAIDLHGVEL
mgnify:FL=1